MKAKSQVELSFPPSPPPSSDKLRALAHATWLEDVLPVFAAAVQRVTPKEAAYLFDISSTYLSDALKEQQNKGVRLEWLVALLVAAPDAVKVELLGALCKVAGFRAPERRRELSEKEELAIYRRAVKRHAPAIAELAEREVEDA